MFRLEKRIQKDEVAKTTQSDTLADTKEAMKSMQENFILVESSLKSKIDNLLQQLNEREVRLVDAEEKIRTYESGPTTFVDPSTDELRNKISELESNNRLLQSQKYELQKNMADLQNQVLAFSKSNSDDVVAEKDIKIGELETLIQEDELQKQELRVKIESLSKFNEELETKIKDLQAIADDLEGDEAKKMTEKEDTLEDTNETVQLRKELDDLNKTMIKVKAQHKSKLKNLQKQLDNIRKVSLDRFKL